MAEWCTKWHMQISTYCPTRKHVHLIVVPKPEDSLVRQ